MFQDFMMRMFTPIFWQEERDERPREELRPLSFAKLRMLIFVPPCERPCCGLAA